MAALGGMGASRGGGRGQGGRRATHDGTPNSPSSPGPVPVSEIFGSLAASRGAAFCRVLPAPSGVRRPQRHARRARSTFARSFGFPSPLSAMSASSLRLMSDLKAMKQSPPEGVSASPLGEESLMVWGATIVGPDDTPFEGGIFSMRITFTEQYPDKPPRVRFTSEMVRFPPCCSQTSACCSARRPPPCRRPAAPGPDAAPRATVRPELRRPSSSGSSRCTPHVPAAHTTPTPHARACAPPAARSTTRISTRTARSAWT